MERNVPQELVATQPDAFNPLDMSPKLAGMDLDSWFQYKSRLLSFVSFPIGDAFAQLVLYKYSWLVSLDKGLGTLPARPVAIESQAL